MNRFFLLLLGASIVSSHYACSGGAKQNKAQDTVTAKVPAETQIEALMDVPPELKEISGISFIDEKNLVAIEDEEGVLYYYNTDSKTVTAKKEFAGHADYEDVAVAGNDMYIVDSSGKLYFIKNFKQANAKPQIIKTPFTEKNNIEGLAYDAANNRLLLAPKDEGFDENKKDTKNIYEYSLTKNQLNTTPVYTIRLTEIEEYFKGDDLEENSKKFLKALGNENLNKIFRTSALSIHPKTKEIYLLSSINNLIAILTPDGKLRKVLLLKGKEFSQPEGLAFTPAGVLYVSNEGKNNTKANIIKLKI